MLAAKGDTLGVEEGQSNFLNFETLQNTHETHKKGFQFSRRFPGLVAAGESCSVLLFKFSLLVPVPARTACTACVNLEYFRTSYAILDKHTHKGLLTIHDVSTHMSAESREPPKCNMKLHVLWPPCLAVSPCCVP